MGTVADIKESRASGHGGTPLGWPSMSLRPVLPLREIVRRLRSRRPIRVVNRGSEGDNGDVGVL